MVDFITIRVGSSIDDKRQTPYLQEFFPGVIQTVYVLRPASFLQKALSEVSSKLFKEEFRFRVLVCSGVEELYEHFDRSQLTPDLGGELQYSHSEWIQQRIVSSFY